MMRRTAQSFLLQNRKILTCSVPRVSCRGLRFVHATTWCCDDAAAAAATATETPTATVTPSLEAAKQKMKSNQKNNKNAARDSRIAGRRRFYQQVGVAETVAPWVSLDDDDDNSSNNSIASPISAGVDGTDSATGVSRKLSKDSALLYQQLSPRRPGTTAEEAEAEANSNSNENTTTTTTWWSVTLDGRSIRTPLGQVLAVPSRQLAYAIAAEWDQQAEKLKPVQMPLMTLACTALDQTSSHAEAYRKQALSYVLTDTVCYWADPTTDRILYRRQEEAWNDLYAHIETSFGETLTKAMGAPEGMIMARNSSVAGLPLTQELKEKCRAWVHTLDAWHLTALHSAASEAKSFWVAWALLDQQVQVQDEQETEQPQQTTSPFAKDLTKAIEAARVEEEFQISSWGLVEGQHDYDRLNCAVQLHAAVLLSDSLAVDNGWL
jgi:ATP synthase F1 complex assembly factor 2